MPMRTIPMVTRASKPHFLILGASLAALGVGLLIAAGMRYSMLIRCKRAPFYLVGGHHRAGRKRRHVPLHAGSGAARALAMLVANAWHARSDAASSLVVIVGIVAICWGIPSSTDRGWPWSV